MKRLALFSAEASLQIGTGHVMRCKVIADELKNAGWDCAFISSETSYDLVTKVREFERIDPELAWNRPPLADLLVVDNYTLDSYYENHFRKSVKAILVIDDMPSRSHNCEILLDQNFGTKISDYQNFVNEGCKILAGTDFSLLRPEFAKIRPLALEKRSQTKKIEKILINFGGSDINNFSLKALEKVEESRFCGIIEVVLGFNATHLGSIQKFATKSKNKIIIHKEVDMSQLILEADLAIAAGGTSTWERCCLGLPTYIIKIADNQEKIFSQLGSNKSFQEFFDDVSANYQKYFEDAARIVDGIGSKRVLAEILKLQ
jgi:UDP-2,4-diacetamido-2,4,6-trideoxy-beta-L-altropyranose hydrolase